jgi:predicted  nucleic acid-binding Zn-ribbon protein
MMDETIATVKDALRTFERAASANPAHASMAERLKKAVADLNEQKRLNTPIPRELGDLSDLPEELIRELSVKRTDELEDQILTVMRACDGGKEVNLDQVLVGLYRKYTVVQTRRFLQNKLYRMYKKGLAFPVSGRRAYSLDHQPEPQGGYDEGYGEMPIAADRSASRNRDLDDEIPF